VRFPDGFISNPIFTLVPKGIPNKGWFSAATDSIEALGSHAKETLVLMNRVQEYQEGPEEICLRCCAITCLVTVAELYDNIFDAKQDDQYSKACMKTLGDISVVTQGLRENEYYLLDPYIGVSGKSTIRQLPPRVYVLNRIWGSF
jgi:hypothetical protein